MRKFVRSLCAAAAVAATLSLPSATATAGIGDLLVAPTRLVLNGGRGSQVILNNIGPEEATYRISAELRRMTPDGKLVEVDMPNEVERMAQEMVFFAPRRVTLPPNQPQAIRIAARAPQGLPDGEYRVHLLFRAVPKPRPVEEAAPAEGISFKLIPVYGVTIPVIVRLGRLEVQAGIAGARVEENGGNRSILVDISRQGGRSVYGDVQITMAGQDEPIASARGVAVYSELDTRTVRVPVRSDYTGPLSGAVHVSYRERAQDGGGLIASADTVLQ